MSSLGSTRVPWHRWNKITLPSCPAKSHSTHLTHAGSARGSVVPANLAGLECLRSASPGRPGTFTAKAVNRGNFIVAGAGEGAILMVTVEETLTVSTLYSAFLLVPAVGGFLSGGAGRQGADDAPPSEPVRVRADVVEHSLRADRTRVLEGTVPLLQGTVVSCAAADVAVSCRLIPLPGTGGGVVVVAYSYLARVQARGEDGKVRVFLLPGPDAREQFAVPLRLARACQAELEVRCLRAVLGPTPP